MLCRESAQWLGLSRADSVPNLTRRVEAGRKASPELSNDLTQILRWPSASAAGLHPDDVTPTRISRRSSQSKTKNKA